MGEGLKVALMGDQRLIKERVSELLTFNSLVPLTSTFPTWEEVVKVLDGGDGAEHVELTGLKTV